MATVSDDRRAAPAPGVPASEARAEAVERVGGQAAAAPAADRTGAIGLWAVIGVIGLAIALQAWIRWFASGTQFSPAPLNNADHYAQWRWISLRAVELISAVVFFWLANLTVVKPLRRERRLGIDGKIFIACFIGCAVDGFLNVQQYIFAWNAHSINRGSWSDFLPFHSSHANGRYAESLIWGIPMYIYFCIGVAIAGGALVNWLQRRRPAMSNMAAYGCVFLAAFVFDFVVENSIIRLTQAYSFPKTTGGLTLWAGSLYQFPIYESVFVGTLGAIFTALRLSAMRDPQGLSFVEQGAQRVPAAYRGAVRLIAVIGFALAMLVLVYHLPLNYLGVTGTSVSHLPSYMRP